MLTPEQLRALVMASIHGPNDANNAHWMHQWEEDRRQRYLAGIRRDADLIIAAAESPAARSEQSAGITVDYEGDRSPLAHAVQRCLSLDVIALIDPVTREVKHMHIVSDLYPTPPAVPAAPAQGAPAFETDEHGERGVVMTSPAPALHEADGIGRCLRCGRELWKDQNSARPCAAHTHRLDQPAASAAS